MSELALSVNSAGYEVGDLVRDEEHNIFELIIESRGRGNGPTQVRVGWELVSSADFQRGIVLWKNVLSQSTPQFAVYGEGKDVISIDSKEALLSFLLQEAKKGLSIQRYKGLGEMNPDQLWDTTMNPQKRTLLKVKVEDMFEAHDIFTVLMGDEVEPRRDFIEVNALDVRRLDI